MQIIMVIIERAHMMLSLSMNRNITMIVVGEQVMEMQKSSTTQTNVNLTNKWK